MLRSLLLLTTLALAGGCAYTRADYYPLGLEIEAATTEVVELSIAAADYHDPALGEPIPTEKQDDLMRRLELDHRGGRIRSSRPSDYDHRRALYAGKLHPHRRLG